MRINVIILFFISLTSHLVAQEEELIHSNYRFNISTGTILNESDFLPHYLLFNRWGAVGEEQDFFVSLNGNYSRKLDENWKIEFGIDIRNDRFIESFGQVDFKDWSFIGGRKKLTYGDIETEISSGSLALSRNAMPIPMIEVRLNKFKSIPFTKGYLKLKGNLSQRWLEEDRYISKALLHGKSLYGILDLDKEIGLKVGSGIIHFAQYGGTSPQGDKQPSAFKDYLRVFMGKGKPNPDGGSAGEDNGLGNHLGMTEISLDKRLGEHHLRLYYQKQFDDEGSMQYVSLEDYLLSLQWTLPKKSFLNSIRVEIMSSKYQGNEGLPDPTEEYPDREANMGYEFGGRDDFYNNYLYKSGWTYKNNVIGSPLFTTYKRTLNYLDPYSKYDVSFSNNRVKGFHLGITGAVSKAVDYRILFTHTRNYGTHAGLYEGRYNWGGVSENPSFEYVFKDGPIQNYSLLELKFNKLFKTIPINAKVMMAYDFGDFYDNFASEISLNYEFLSYKK
jgi:capsule assembly protein Wzi